MTHAEALAATIPMKPPMRRAPGLDCRRQDGRVILIRRWLRPKHYFLALLVAGACVWLGGQWGQAQGVPGFLIVATLFCASSAYNVMSTFVNQTNIVVSSSRISVSHGPVPSPFGLNREVTKEQVQGFAVEPRGAHFAVVYRVEDGETRTLVSPLPTLEQARFIEYQFCDVWGLRPSVDEEKSTSLEKSGKAAGLVALLVPLLIGGAVLFFFNLTSAEVNGSLHSASQWTFTPDHCTSGERDGFAGVSLTQTGSERAVRVVNDPIRGKLLVVVEPGEDNQIISGKGCSSFELKAARTDTNVNEIWLVDGSVDLQCPELSGRLSFQGCQ